MLTRSRPRVLMVVMAMFTMVTILISPAHAAPTCTTAPKLDGSFAQPKLIDDFTDAQLSNEINVLTGACMTDQILQWTADTKANTTVYPSGLGSPYTQSTKTDVVGTFVLVGKSRADQPGSGPGTWKWTGGRWTLLSSTVPVDATSLAYDPVSHRLIAYAGQQPFSPKPGMGVSSVSGYSRTWAFTGGRWVELLSENTPVQQPEDAPGVLAPGPDDGRLMLINALGRTWTWTGRGWRPYLTRGGPAGGRVPWGGTLLTAGADPARHQLVLLATGSNDETWTLSSGRWTRRAGTP